MRQAEKKAIASDSARARAHPVLRDLDPEIEALIGQEVERQRDKIILIASESVCPLPVLEALASSYNNIYAEGYPSSRMAVLERDTLEWSERHLSFYRRYGDRRYYRGCDFVNLVESVAIKRVCELFATDAVASSRLFANVQSLSGAAANNAVYNALLKPGDTVMGMHLSYGGHLTHGSPVNRSGRLFRIMPYTADPRTGEFDWDRMKSLAKTERPRMIIAGASSFPWALDWRRFREVADVCGAYLLADIAHHAGLIAARALPSPVGIADVVTFTTHKTLCGPRGAAVLTTDPRIAKAIDLGVFPGEQGGPHVHAIAAKAVTFAVASTPAFRQLMAQVLENSRALADALKQCGQTLAYGGTNTHLCLIDLKGLAVPGERVLSADIAARLLDLAGITCNKNAIAGDVAAAHPTGLRFGATWVAQRGLKPADMSELAQWIDRVLRGCRSYVVHAVGGAVGRAKIDPTILREVSASVVAMLKRAPQDHTIFDGVFAQDAPPFREPLVIESPLLENHKRQEAHLVEHHGRRVPLHFGHERAEDDAAGKSAIVCDCSDKGLISVRGERAFAMLQEVLTANVAVLHAGMSVRSLVLDGKGRILDDVLVHRLANDAHDLPHYLLSVHGHAREQLLAWLQALSDGYAEFDPDGDPYRKIDGPVVVEDLSAHEDASLRRVTIGLAGPRASEMLTEIASLKDVTQFQNRQATVAGASVLISVGSLNGDDPTIEFYVAATQAEAVYSELLRTGAKHGVLPAGLRTRGGMRRKSGLPDFGVGEIVRVADVQGKQPHLIDARKPYFVGRRALAPSSEGGKPWFVFTPPAGPLRATPLIDEHRQRTAKWNLVPFAGWEMPVLYTSITEEHRTVRTAAGLFDVAHMGVLEVSGKDAERFLDLVTTNYVPRLRDGQCQYSYVLDPSGAVMDDIIVYRRRADRFMVVVNASNAEKILAWLRAVNARSVAIDPTDTAVEIDAEPLIRDLKDGSSGADRRVDLAFQGPASLPVLQSLSDQPELRRRLAELDRFEMAEGTVGGIDLIIAKTGYTGEDSGFELFVHPDSAVRLFHLLLDRGADLGVRATGLGARDSTRTEAGFPLYGHELAGEFDISPLGAGYPGFVKFHKPFFVGREASLRREAERRSETVRLEFGGTQVRAVRPLDPVTDARGRCVGRITSACYVGSSQIAIAYVERNQLREGARVSVFTLPRDGKALAAEKAKDQIKPGDRVLLPIEGKVLPRFMSRTERTARIESAT